MKIQVPPKWSELNHIVHKQLLLWLLRKLFIPDNSTFCLSCCCWNSQLCNRNKWYKTLMSLERGTYMNKIQNDCMVGEFLPLYEGLSKVKIHYVPFKYLILLDGRIKIKWSLEYTSPLRTAWCWKGQEWEWFSLNILTLSSRNR